MNPALAIQAAGAGAQMMGTYANVGMNLLQNRWQRKHELKMYNMQRQHALEDWNRQNAYNHPLQQRARLKEAGLNPNLVYGKGADVTAGSIRPTSMDSKQQIPVQIDTGMIGRAFQGLQVAEKLDMDSRIKKQQELLLMAQIAKEWGIVDKNGLEYKKALETYDIQVATMKAEQMIAESGVTAADLENRKTELIMLQIQQDMDISEERRLPILEKLSTETELGKQALKLNIKDDQRKQLMNQSDLRLAAITYQKILLNNLLTEQKTITEKSQSTKINAEIANLRQTLENLEANRQYVKEKTYLTQLQAAWQSVQNDWQGAEKVLRVFTTVANATTPPVPGKGKTSKK